MSELDPRALQVAVEAAYDREGLIGRKIATAAVEDYLAATPKDASTQPVGEAIDKLMHAWVMGERWVRLDDVKAALATQATAIPVVSAVLEPLDFKDSRCSNVRRANGQPYPRTCQICELGPCRRATQATATQATT